MNRETIPKIYQHDYGRRGWNLKKEGRKIQWLGEKQLTYKYMQIFSDAKTAAGWLK